MSARRVRERLGRIGGTLTSSWALYHRVDARLHKPIAIDGSKTQRAGKANCEAREMTKKREAIIETSHSPW